MNPFVWGLLVVLGLIIVVALGFLAYLLWDLWKLESKLSGPQGLRDWETHRGTPREPQAEET